MCTATPHDSRLEGDFGVSLEFNVRLLRVEDAGPLVALRREALETDPMAFGSSIEDDRGLSLELVRTSLADHEEQAVFGCLEGDHLRGMVGVMRASKIKQRHTGSIWGMYVTHRARSGGAGRALLNAAIRQAREWELVQLQLGVMETAHTAKRLYEAAGFRSWGREPRALHWKGRFVDEYHLVLGLGESARAAQPADGLTPTAET
jgi:GNAT superfamily N-acetyltransferase